MHFLAAPGAGGDRLTKPEVDVFEFLLMTSLVAATPAPYAVESTYFFVAAANDRIVDGISYTDGNGVLSAGVLHVQPSGLFAGTELSRFRGDGRLLPDNSLWTLETALGWRVARDADAVSVSLLDYRLNRTGLGGTGSNHDHQGLALTYRRGAFTAEFGVERDKPYYYRRYDAFFPHSIRRTAFSWTRTITATSRWSLGVGALWLDQPDQRQDFATASLAWEWIGFEWQVSASHGTGLDGLSGAASGTHALLRIAKPFRL